jgi:hypothetical protein
MPKARIAARWCGNVVISQTDAPDEWLGAQQLESQKPVLYAPPSKSCRYRSRTSGVTEFGVDFRGDAAGVSHHELDVFEAESFGAEDGGVAQPFPTRTLPGGLSQAQPEDGLKRR